MNRMFFGASALVLAWAATPASAAVIYTATGSGAGFHASSLPNDPYWFEAVVSFGYAIAFPDDFSGDPYFRVSGGGEGLALSYNSATTKYPTMLTFQGTRIADDLWSGTFQVNWIYHGSSSGTRVFRVDAGTGVVRRSVNNQIRAQPTVLDITASIPEPASWAMMIGGFGLVGASMRRRGDRAIRV